jgi:hypothetical protein
MGNEPDARWPAGWIPDDEIHDRREYEERLVLALTDIARSSEVWKYKKLRLSPVAIIGSYPDTGLGIRVVSQEGEEKFGASIAVWPTGNGRQTPDRVWRWTADHYASIISDAILEEIATSS